MAGSLGDGGELVDMVGISLLDRSPANIWVGGPAPRRIYIRRGLDPMSTPPSPPKPIISTTYGRKTS